MNKSQFTRPFLVAIMMAYTLVTTSGCGDKNGGADTAADTTAQAIVVGPENYAIVTQQRIESGPAISGTLSPKEEATMRAQISGAVLRTYADQGEHVGRGALLAKLDARAIGDAVTSAQAGVTSARNNLDVARREVSRMESLQEVGAIAERDVDNARRGVISAEAAVAQAQAQLTAARKQLSLTEVRAPFGGVVSAKLVSTGDIVQPGSALYTIVDPSSMQLEASLPAEDMAVVKVGTSIQFTVSGYPDRTFNGTITRINPTADPATRQVKVFAQIPNSGSTLLGDLFAQGRVTAEAHSALTVPSSALDRRMMKPRVTKLINGEAKYIEVTVGVTDEQADIVEILSGVAPGDTLLTGAAREVSEGTPIRTAKGTPVATETRARSAQ